MKLQPVLFAIACTCVVLSAPAKAMGVIDLSTTSAPGKGTASTRQAARAQQQPPAGDHGYQVTALTVAAMLLAARSIGRRLQ